MKKIIYLFLLLLLLPFSTKASPVVNSIPESIVYKAKVLEIIEEKSFSREDGTIVTQQNLLVKIANGDLKGEEKITTGIGEIDVVHHISAQKGDNLLIMKQPLTDGQEIFVVTDFVRQKELLWLFLFFILAVIIIGKNKGFKSLLSLSFTFLIIMFFIIPQILQGKSPLLISIIGSAIIIASVIYITWGWQKKSHLSVLAISCSLLLTGLISFFFTKISNLSGLAGEDIMFLIGTTKQAINFQGLLLAGMIIGSLGVLDDVVISQISAVEQLHLANKKMSFRELFKKAMTIGTDHISSMTNTLFLAYAGVSLPLLMLFSVKNNISLSIGEAINNEIIATEIVRTLTGSIGLIMAMPLATLLAVYFFRQEK